MAVYKPKKDPKNWWIDYRVDGKRHARKLGPSKREADRALNLIKAQIAAGTYYEAHRVRLTVADLVARYFESPKNPQKRTLATDRHRAERLKEHFGAKIADTLTPKDVKLYQRKRQGETSRATGRPPTPATLNREVATLSLIYATGILHGDVSKNPCQGVRKLREDNIRTHQLSHDAFLRLMEALPASNKAGPWRPFIACAYYTGMRKGEILKLTWDRVDLKGDEEGNRWFYLRRGDTKTDQARKVPVPEPLLPYLEALPRDTPGFFLFTWRGKRWEAKDFTTWKLALKAAGVDGTLHIHDLRHQFVTQAIRAGAPEPFIMEITGHRTRSVFDRYVDANGADLRRVMQQMATIWRPSEKEEEAVKDGATLTD